jgi:hypothetical protein
VSGAVKVQAPGSGGTGSPSGRDALAAVVVYGPQGCGKTTNAQRIRQALGLQHVIDDWHPGDPKPADTLLLTCVDDDSLPRRRALSFAEAMLLVRDEGL